MKLQFDPRLIRKYNGPGPRYTSYPTAPHFRDGFGPADRAPLVEAGNGDPIPRPLSIYLHLPFCSSPCFYCACHRVITRDSRKAEAYLRRLKREIGLQARDVDADRAVRQVHLGGGTPNFYSVDQLADLLDTIARHFRFAAPGAREVAIELDPRRVAPGDLARLAGEGFNRASFGLQDLNDDVQRAVNRVQGSDECLALIEEARGQGFGSINVDLMYGLPRQTPGRFAETVEKVITARPDRIALYGYAHMPDRFRPQVHIHDGELPSPEERLRIFCEAVEQLTDAGYEYIGMDHFALPEDSLARARRMGTLIRNFQGYSTGDNTDILGMGVTAISQYGTGYAQNTTDLLTYYNRIDNDQLAVERGLFLTPEDHLRAELIQAIMCRGHVDIADVEERHHIRFRSHFAAELGDLEHLEADGLVTIDEKSIRVTETGRLLLRPVAMVFDAWLRRESEGRRYSRII